MHFSLEGKLFARHRSEGFAHPMKRWFSFLIPSTVCIDEVKIFKVCCASFQSDLPLFAVEGL